jgi:hypothetical protein
MPLPFTGKMTVMPIDHELNVHTKGILDSPALSSIKYPLILVVCMVWYYMNYLQAKRSQYKWVICEYLSFVLSMKFAIIHSLNNMYSNHFRQYIKDIKLDLDATVDWHKSGAAMEEGDLKDDAGHGVSCNIMVCDSWLRQDWQWWSAVQSKLMSREICFLLLIIVVATFRMNSHLSK